MLFAKLWTFWIAVPLVAGAVLFGLATIAGYIQKVIRPKYPSNARRS